MYSTTTRTAIQAAQATAALIAATLAFSAPGAAPPPGVAPPPDELDAIAGATAPVPIELGELSWNYPTSGVTRDGDILANKCHSVYMISQIGSHSGRLYMIAYRLCCAVGDAKLAVHVVGNEHH